MFPPSVRLSICLSFCICRSDDEDFDDVEQLSGTDEEDDQLPTPRRVRKE